MGVRLLCLRACPPQRGALIATLNQLAVCSRFCDGGGAGFWRAPVPDSRGTACLLGKSSRHDDKENMLGSSADSPYSAGQTVAQCSQMVRMGFIRKVYGILSVQLAMTGVMCALAMKLTASEKVRVDGSWLCVCARSCVRVRVCLVDVCAESRRRALHRPCVCMCTRHDSPRLDYGLPPACIRWASMRCFRSGRSWLGPLACASSFS